MYHTNTPVVGGKPISNLSCVVLRSIVDDQHFPVRIRLLHDRFNAFLEVAGHVIRGDNYR